MMPHHEHEPLPRRQPRDLRFEHLAELARRRPAPPGPGVSSGVFTIRNSASSVNGAQPGRRLPAPVVDARVHDDPVQPRRQLRVVAEPVERAVDLDEDVLRDVLGIVVVAGELVGQPIHHRAMPLDERMKRGASPAAARATRSESAVVTEAAVHCQEYDVTAA